MNIKEWLETTGLPVAETAFKSEQQTPFVVFLDQPKRSGHDMANCLTEHDITIELYADNIDEENENEIENLLDERAIEYEKDRTYIDTERFFMTIYTLNYMERKK